MSGKLLTAFDRIRSFEPSKPGRLSERISTSTSHLTIRRRAIAPNRSIGAPGSGQGC